MYLFADRRKPANFVLFTLIWTLSLLAFSYQYTMERKEADEQWQNLAKLLRGQIRMAANVPVNAYTRDECINVVAVLTWNELRQDETRIVRKWVNENLTTKLAEGTKEQIKGRILRIKPLALAAAQRHFPVHRNIVDVFAWGIWAFLYVLLTLLLYSLSSLRAIETEPLPL